MVSNLLKPGLFLRSILGSGVLAGVTMLSFLGLVVFLLFSGLYSGFWSSVLDHGDGDDDEGAVPAPQACLLHLACSSSLSCSCGNFLGNVLLVFFVLFLLDDLLTP